MTRTTNTVREFRRVWDKVWIFLGVFVSVTLLTVYTVMISINAGPIPQRKATQAK